MARRKRRRVRPVAAFDLDGSLVREQLIILLFREFFELGVFPRDAEITFNELFIDHRDRRISFHVCDEKLVALFNRSIKGKFVDDVRAAARRVAANHRDWLYTFTRTMLTTLKPTHEMITITGAMQEVVETLAPYWGFEDTYATRMEKRRGKFTGRDLDLPVLDKREALARHMKKRKGCVTLKGSVAIGDTSSDIPLLEAVSYPIAFNPSDGLASEAERRHWPIVVERKDCIYVMCSCDAKRFQIDDVQQAVNHALHFCTLRKE